LAQAQLKLRPQHPEWTTLTAGGVRDN
jgi:hypothetical protein